MADQARSLTTTEMQHEILVRYSDMNDDNNDGGLRWFAEIGQYEQKLYDKGDYMKNIASALVSAQRNYSPALKTNTNPHFRSKYADLAACVEAVVDALNESGIALMQRCHECDNGVIVETVFIHESGEMLDAGRLHVPASKADPQGYGSALTYARRYSLMAACGIAPEDDDGNAAARPARPAGAQPPPPEEMCFSAIADHMAAINGAATLDELKSAYGAAFKAAKAANDADALGQFDAAKEIRKAALSEPAAT